MRLLGFNFHKINVEKGRNPPGELKVSTNIDVSEVEYKKQPLLRAKGDLIEVVFEYVINYTPDFAKIQLKGSFILEVESRVSREVLRMWKEKKMPEDFRVSVFNVIIKKASVKALQLEEEMNLPYHMPLPGVKIEERA